MTDTSSEHRWAAAVKDFSETKPVVLRCSRLCKVFWEDDEQWDLGEFCWPTKASGFVAECTTAGRSASKEPRWNFEATANATYQDGSVVWTLRVPSGVQGIQPITNVMAEAPDGIIASGAVVSENTKVLVDYLGGTEGKSYDVKYTLTIAGRARVGRQTVTVTER